MMAIQRRTIYSKCLIAGMELVFLIVCCLPTIYARPDDKEPAAILELGGASAKALGDGTTNAGPTVAVELTPIENWLELEAGVTPSFGKQSRDWETDLLFKKPWELSKKLEFMVGLGPAWVHSRQNNITTNSVAGEAVLDFMFWPGKQHRLGWYVEPAYEYSFGPGHERSIGVSGGLLIAMPRRTRAERGMTELHQVRQFK